LKQTVTVNDAKQVGSPKLLTIAGADADDGDSGDTKEDQLSSKHEVETTTNLLLWHKLAVIRKVERLNKQYDRKAINTS
jgi:hypothetical protein